MNIAAKIEPVETSIALLVLENPAIVLKEPAKLAALYDKMKADVAAHKPDLTTDKGRKEIASLAYKIVRTKTAIDDAGKAMNDDANKAIAEVNAKRKDIREKLDEMRDQVRRPLTDWEAAEKIRTERVHDDIDAFRRNAIIPMGMTASELAERIADLTAQIIDPAIFQDRTDEAVFVKTHSLQAMTEAHARIVKEEADRAELEALREAEKQRLRDAAEKAAQEAEVARLKAETEAAEQRRIADEKAALERLQAAEKRAQEEATAAAERKAREEREALERKHAAELKAEQDKAAAIEKKRQDDAAEDKRIADEKAAREADVAHRSRIMKGAKEAIMTCGADEETARKIVLAIKANEIPNITIAF